MTRADPLSTELTRRLGCRLPVIQTAMGWIAEPRLVAASSEAGAFGFLAAAVMTPAEVEAGIAATRTLTSRSFGVNFHMFQPGAQRIVEIILANRDHVRAVSFGRGPDAAMIAAFRAAGILCVPTVGAVKHARAMADLGVDMLVVQGSEGGGHSGSVATNILLPQVLDAVEVPVIAAGGFSDGRGLAAALAYGAAGIAMGTRFLLTRESPVPAATLERYLAASDGDIILSTRIDGIPQRVLRSAMVDRIEKTGRLAMWWRGLASALAMKHQTGASWRSIWRSARGMIRRDGNLAQALMAAAAPMLIRRAVVQGRPDEGVMASGAVAARIRDLPSCTALLAAIEVEARARLAALSGTPMKAIA